MFGKRKQHSTKQQRQEPAATTPAADAALPGEPSGGSGAAKPAAKPAQPPESAKSAKSAQPGAASKPASKPDASAFSRPATGPARADSLRRPVSAPQGQGGGGEGRKLIVGRDIALSGEIQSCDKLIVEGKVEAELSDSEALEVTSSGVYKGTAVIDTADIAGRFEGDLTVRERLFLRATGQVHGTIRYKALEIEGGGRIGGTMIELTDDEAAKLREAKELGTAANDGDAGHPEPVETSAPTPDFASVSSSQS